MINDDFSNIERTNRGMQSMGPEMQYEQEAPVAQQQQEMAQQMAATVQCPHCGTINEAEAVFCASCGQPLHTMNCPHCGAEVDPDADYCEVCHHYIRKDICSFCGAQLGGNEAYCPECGSPRGGIVCPVCHTLNSFAFCKQCGNALTEEAKLMVKELQTNVEYKELQDLVAEFNQLDDMVPYNSERDIVREKVNAQLRERVLKLLAEDRGIQDFEVPVKTSKRMTKEELKEKKNEKIKEISSTLDKFAVPQQPSPVKARNFAMACKPVGVRLAWVCNWKHAMHSSPCGCAKPQLGGKWVVLGKNTSVEIKDDNK